MLTRLLALALAATALSSAQSAPPVLQGHSMQGQTFDVGPRGKPWVIEGIGEAHFPISTKNPEVQKWFDQGNALMHSFWYYEAERAFRWCLKLEPENPMAYYGLARAASGDRAKDFMREAVKRKAHGTERERLYIESLAARLLPDPLAEKEDSREMAKQQRMLLETLCVKYPDDMEARAQLALLNMGTDRYGAELMIREILAKQPNHPGAHHYRIHNWDYNQPEQALESCRRYTELVPGIGHAQHMPGHIYSIIGMWNEAAISMDAATRVEKRYMQQSLTFPFNNWNYPHNMRYLCYIQEQLGMVNAAIAGSKELFATPRDPVDNADGPYSAQTAGKMSLARALLRFERWDELLKPKSIPWGDTFRDKVSKAYFECRGWFGKGDVDKAGKAYDTFAALKKDLDKNKDMERTYSIYAKELKARLAIARGETIVGLGLLAEAAQSEYDLQKQYADPPDYPEALFTSLGEAYLTAKSPLLAAQAFEKALGLVHNDLFTLSGLVRAYAALGEKEKARDAMAELLFVTADADPGLKPVERAKATGITAVAHDNSPATQRNYARTSLERFGPNRWEPYDAPSLDVRDSDGKPVSLNEYRGKNVMLIFYLGQTCPHCVRQLHDIEKKKDDWDRLQTSVLAVSSTTPEKNATWLKELGAMPIRLLSDDHYSNARRFHSYDDFEEIELHSTILIDKKGRVYWARVGGDPFSDTAFLAKQLERMNAQ